MSEASDQAADQAETPELERARYRSLVRSSRDGIIQATPTGNIIGWNDGAERIFGYTPQEAEGQPIAMLMPERYREAHRAGLKRYLETGEGNVIGETLELHGLHKDGTTFPIELTLDTFTVNGARYFSGIIRDITQRKRAEEELEKHARQLEKSNQSWEEFGHIVSHDLKAPLHTIVNHLHRLEQEHEDALDDDALEAIDDALSGVQHMSDLLDGLLQFARVEAHNEPTATTDTNELMDDIQQHLAAQIAEHNATVTVDELPPIQAEPVQIHQLLQNLVSNAVKHNGGTPAHVRVYAEPADEEDAVVLCVEDDGPGIPPDQQKNIFEMFHRGPDATATEGSGVGLAICQRIAARYGGEVRVESTPGEGSTFRATLPRADA